MPFPSDRRYPASLPGFLLAGHELAVGERVDPVQFDQGEDRHRDTRTFTPWLASVATWLTQAQLDLFHNWFEGDAEGGTALFDVQVHSLVGGAPQWWQARFVGPYRLEARSARYTVSAELILLDGPYATRPDVGLRGYELGDGDETLIAPLPPLFGHELGDGDETLIAPLPPLFGHELGDGDEEGFLGNPPDDPTVDGLMMVWMGLGSSTPASVADSDDALTSQWMGL